MLNTKFKNKKKITVIDNDKSITTILDFILTQYGFEVQSLKENVIDNFILSSKPHLILLDQNINTNISVKLFKELTINHPSIPVISMVGKKIKINYFQNTYKSIAGYIYKPLDTEEVVKKIKEILK